jgi:hypothetical protein
MVTERGLMARPTGGWIGPTVAVSSAVPNPRREDSSGCHHDIQRLFLWR